MAFVFPAFPATHLPIQGTDDLFPVRRIFCVGRNYADHVVEMGGDPDREEPFFFTKPADAIALADEVTFPSRTQDLHHEMELIIAIGLAGSELSLEQAPDHIFGYGAGVDLTRRDLQAEAKKRGRPWDMAKGFDESAPMTPIRSVADIGHPETGRIFLSVNSEVKQDGDLAQQVWKVPEIVANLSTYVALEAGDLIMTGTPAGVGPLAIGDRIEGGIDGIGTLSFTMVSNEQGAT